MGMVGAGDGDEHGLRQACGAVVWASDDLGSRGDAWVDPARAGAAHPDGTGGAPSSMGHRFQTKMEPQQLLFLQMMDLIELLKVFRLQLQM